MNLLLLNQFYPPDPAPTGQLLADLARELAEAGHRVTVVCGRSSYAGGSETNNEPACGSKSGDRQLCPRANDAWDRDVSPRFSRVEIRRVWAPRFGHGTAARLLSYGCFYLGALRRALAGPRPDLVLTMTTPPLLSAVGALARKLRGSRHYVWEMDVYPEVAVALGRFRAGSLAARVAGAVADWSRRHADGVIALGPCMRELLCRRGLDGDKVRVVENWADSREIVALPHAGDGRLKILYSGNLGLAHEVDTVAAVMERLKEDDRFRFTFAGGGARRGVLERFCRERAIPARFLSYQPAREMTPHLAGCDLGLVTQRPETLGTVVPSKIYPLMAAGRAVLFIGPRESTAAGTLERFGCGWQIDPGDVEGALALLDLLAADPRRVREAGRRGHEAFAAHYDRGAGVARAAEALGLAPAGAAIGEKR